MCKLKSAIILKDRIFLPDYDSHSDMLEELGIKDDYLHASKTFVRVELSPKNGDVFTDIDTWELNVDQDIVPDWFDKDAYKPQLVEKVKAWANDHIHIGKTGLRISEGQNHYIKDCKDVEVYGSATVNKVYGSATVNYVYDSATVNYVYGSATVNKVYGSATVNYVFGSATVNYVYGSATVNYVYGSATVNYVFGSATVNYVFGSATVNYVYGSATVNKVYDSATVNYVYGYATVISSPYSRWNKKDKVILCDNATFKDCYEKVIYQAGDWKLVAVKKKEV